MIRNLKYGKFVNFVKRLTFDLIGLFMTRFDLDLMIYVGAAVGSVWRVDRLQLANGSISKDNVHSTFSVCATIQFVSEEYSVYLELSSMNCFPLVSCFS